ncbi:hypothetical protein UZ36_05870 [Candidatus Nitromaritima sp. SCGC AAA799-C22]|nr:hypothetical protein UZ36_05870 [Candidatus Nitromaritima sp. SCGC AAA799-C22]
MPPKIRKLWIVCNLIVVFGFLYLSLQNLVVKEREKEERVSQAARQASAAKESKPGTGQTFKTDPLKDIRELNAQGQYDEAAKLAESVAALNPDHPKVYTWWGISLVKNGKKKEAIEKFVRAADLDSTYSKTFLYWGLTLVMDGKPKEAIAKYKKVIALEPENSNAYAYWGAALGQLDQHEQAVEKLERALEIQPKNANVFGVLVDSLYHLKKYREAWRVVKKAQEAQVTIPENSLKRLEEVLSEPAGM